VGAILDIVVDLRQGSQTYAKWESVELTAANRRLLYVPEGFAHGFQTLCDSTEVFYQISAPYNPVAALGLRWNDPVLGIQWPDPHTPIMSHRDRSYPNIGLRP
jgi:dTDP-4-dehydrorhamnose 3,5-epimerase